LNVTGGGVNALPYPDNLTFEVYVTDAKGQSLTNSQAQNGSHRKNGAQRFWCIGNHLSHFVISEAAWLFLNPLAWQCEVFL